MIKDILEKVSFDKYEKEYYEKALVEHNSLSDMNDLEYDITNDLLKKHLLYFNYDQYVFKFAKSATDLIKQLFEKYVDDDTLIVTTDNEHPNVRDILHGYSNVVYAIQKQHYVPFTVNKKYKRIFIYMIGAYCGSGHIVKNKEFEFVIANAKAYCDEVISVIDAVQELFLYPRDYHLFDYIIGTGHALIEKYNVGFVLSKRNDIGINTKAAYTFAYLLDILLQRRCYLNEFSNLMSEYFTESYYYKCQSRSELNHLFMLESKGNIFDGLIQEGEILPGVDDQHNGILLRGCWSVVNKEGFLNKLDIVDFALENFKNNQ